MSIKNAIVTNQEKMGNLKSLLEKSRGKIHAVLPAHLSAERMVKIAMVAASRNPLLLQCSPMSILTALMESSQLGLEPFTGLQQSYIIPYKNNRTNQYEAQFMPSYRGLIDLARRSGNIISIEAHVVHERDHFEFELGTTPKLKHVPALDGLDRGKVILAYAIAMLKDGGMQSEVMTRSEIEDVRKASKAANSGPWTQWWSEMAKKTVLKRLVKYLPVSVEMARAITKDNANESDEVFDVDSFDLDEETVDQPKSSVDSLTKKLEDMTVSS